MTLGFEKQAEQGVETGFLIDTLASDKGGYTLALGLVLDDGFHNRSIKLSYALSFSFWLLWQPLIETGARYQST